MKISLKVSFGHFLVIGGLGGSGGFSKFDEEGGVGLSQYMAGALWDEEGA